MSDTPRLPLERPLPGWQAHAQALALTGAMAALLWPLNAWLHPVNVAMLLLTVVVWSAYRWGRHSAILSALTGVLIFDVGFVPPKGSLAVDDLQFVITFAVMMSVGWLIAHLADHLKQQLRAARQQADQTQGLYQMASELAAAMSPEQVLLATQTLLQGHGRGHPHARPPATPLRMGIWLMEPGREPHALGLPEHAHASVAPVPMEANLVRAAWVCFESGRPHESTHLDLEHRVLLHPLKGTTRVRGVLVLSTEQADDPWRPDAPLVGAVASLVSAALERLHFVNVAHLTQMEVTQERLRASILAALSHDIRTPLTTLYGTADALRLAAPDLSGPALDMVQVLRDQAWRLNQMVVKLLEMARLQTGQLKLRREWQPLEEVVGASIQSLGPALGQTPVEIDIAPDLPWVHIDAVLFERVLANLLENAVKHGTREPGLRRITLSARKTLTHWQLDVDNVGPGFPDDGLARVFDLFERGQPHAATDARSADQVASTGVGLGLAICKAIVEAHGGSIQALNRPGGACVRVAMPLGEPPAWPQEESA
jgi:two-component system, OmpR family, sensor histidine kinase KdpD